MSVGFATTRPEQFTQFGDLLRFLRIRAGMNQRELAIAVGYSEAQISRLEKASAALILIPFAPPFWQRSILMLHRNGLNA